MQPVAELFDLSGRTAIVTGGAKGIGEAIARRLAEAGADVVVADTDIESAERVASTIRTNGQLARATECDVSNDSDRRAVVSFATTATGNIDILINNAGIFPFSPSLETSETLWDRVMNINLKGTFFLTQNVARAMAAAKRGGSIVNVSSIDGYHPTGGLAHYDASKGGIEMLTRSLALEFAPLGIRVNAVAPGGVQTPGAADIMKTMAQGADIGAVQKAFDARIPLGRMGSPDDIARAVLFLSSAASSYVTGRSLVVDGGYLLA